MRSTLCWPFMFPPLWSSCSRLLLIFYWVVFLILLNFQEFFKYSKYLSFIDWLLIVWKMYCSSLWCFPPTFFIVFDEQKFFFFLFELYFIFLSSRFLLVIYFIHIGVYMSIPISQFITPPPPPHFPALVSICLFSAFVSLFLPCKPVHLYHFSRFHIYALIYDICFSLSDLLHSVWPSLGPSTSLQMTQFRSFLWLSNIPLYICATSSLSICLSMGI